MGELLSCSNDHAVHSLNTDNRQSICKPNHVTFIHSTKPFKARYYEAISDYNPRYFSTRYYKCNGTSKQRRGTAAKKFDSKNVAVVEFVSNIIIIIK